MAKGQLRVVETKKLKHGRVQVMNVNRIFHRFETELIRRGLVKNVLKAYEQRKTIA